MAPVHVSHRTSQLLTSANATETGKCQHCAVVHATLDQTAKGDRIGRLVSAGLIALIAANVAAVVIEF